MIIFVLTSYVPCKHVFALGPTALRKIHVYRAHTQINTKITMK